MTYKEKYLLSKSWRIKVSTVYKYHKKQHDKFGKEWKIRFTAQYFGISLALVSENLKLGKNLDKLVGCKSRNQALKLIKDE